MEFPRKTKAGDTILWLVFFATIVMTYFFALDLPLIGPDEPRYAQVAKEMYQRRDFITPTLGGFEWFEKPVLLYWLQILSYSIFGISEFSARFGSALSGLLTILFLWILGKATSKNTNFANWLGLIAGTSIGMIAFSRGASFDIILTFAITASLASFFISTLVLKNKASESIENSESEAKTLENTGPVFILARKGNPFLTNQKFFLVWLFGFYFFAGIALLAKGLVGIIFPFSIVALFYLLQRRIPPREILTTLPFGVFLSLAVAGTWYLPMYEKHGWKFVDEFIIQHHFERYTSNKYLHPQPFWFFWFVLPLMTLPWMPFFLPATWKFLKKIPSTITQAKGCVSKSDRSSVELFAFCWMIVPLVFFSFSGSKLPGYILPSLPAACILTASFLHELVEKRPALSKTLFSTAFATLLLVIVLLKFFANDLARHEILKPLLMQAHEKGYTSNKILTLHTIAHNLEFYSTERLVRTNEGRQRYFYGVAEIVEFMRLNDKETVLVLVPLRYEKEIAETSLLESEKLGDNGELSLFVASRNDYNQGKTAGQQKPTSSSVASEQSKSSSDVNLNLLQIPPF